MARSALALLLCAALLGGSAAEVAKGDALRASAPAPLKAADPLKGPLGRTCAVDGTCPTNRCEICGNYCGPGWCSSDCVSESNCSYAAAPQDGSCTDTCCMAHDKCCGCYGEDDLTICDPVSGKGQELCNTQFTDCLNNCKLLDSCHATDGSRWGPSLIKLAFGFLQNHCCGKVCPS